jgi:hypothetical protein
LNGPTRVDITLPKPRPANIPQTAPAIDKNALLNSLQQYQTFIGLLGDIATTDQTVKAKEDALSAAWIQSGVSVGKYKDAILALTATQHDYSRASLQAQMGVQTFDVQAMAAKEVAANIKAGLVPLDQYNNALTASINKWKSLSEQAQVAGSNFPQLTQLALDAGNLNKQLDTLAVGGLNDLSDGLVSIMNGTATVGDAFKNMGAQVVTALEKMIIQMTIVQPIANSLKMALGGSGGGGLLSLFGLNIGHNAMGTDNWRGGLTMVGEQGPELVNLPRGAQVVPNNKVASVLSSGGGQAIQISITNAPVFNNADPTVEARLRQQIAQTAADTQQKTIAAVAKLNQNSPGNYLPRGR